MVSRLSGSMKLYTFTGFGMWSVLVVQSEHHVIYRLLAVGEGGGREAQANMEETDDREILP